MPLLLVAATLVSFGVALQWWSVGVLPNLGKAFLAEIPVWWSWAALAPLIFRAGSHWPLTHDRRLPHLIIHAFLALCCSALVVTVALLVRLAFGYGAGEPVLAGIWHGIRSTFAVFSLIYFALLGLYFVGAYRAAALRETERKIAAEAELARTSLRMLQFQLQPHFLFNTLNTISAFVTRDPPKARTMIVLLSDLLRGALEFSRAAHVPLHQEVAFEQTYLEIQRLRFGTDLRVHVHVSEEAAEVRVPPMLLQPLIENALTHGVPRAEAPQITVSAGARNGAVEILVTDNGPGPSVRGALDGQGMRVVRNMLRHMYGEAAVLEIRPASGGGAEVSMLIPSPFSEQLD